MERRRRYYSKGGMTDGWLGPEPPEFLAAGVSGAARRFNLHASTIEFLNHRCQL